MGFFVLLVYNANMTDKLENSSDKVEIKRDEKGRILPGQVSLNPAGKPRGIRPLSSLLAEALKKQVLNKEGKSTGKTYEDLLIERVLERAISKGDFKHSELIFDRIEGKAPQTININPTDDVSPETKEKIEQAIEKYLHGRNSTNT